MSNFSRASTMFFTTYPFFHTSNNIGWCVPKYTSSCHVCQWTKRIPYPSDGQNSHGFLNVNVDQISQEFDHQSELRKSIHNQNFTVNYWPRRQVYKYSIHSFCIILLIRVLSEFITMDYTIRSRQKRVLKRYSS